MGSRSLQVGGVAVHEASIELVDRPGKLAADALEAAPEDIVLDKVERALPRGRDPGGGRTWKRAGRGRRAKGGPLWPGRPRARPGRPSPSEPTSRSSRWTPRPARSRPTDTSRSTTPAASSTRCSPRASGTAGIAQGAAQALCEEVGYDEDGNPVTRQPGRLRHLSAAELPRYETGQHRDADPAQPARREGHRRVGHDRLDAGGAERRRRRPRPPRGPPHRHAGHPERVSGRGHSAHRRPGGQRLRRPRRPRRHRARRRTSDVEQVSITLNGRPRRTTSRPRTLLRPLPPRAAGLTGTNIGCDTTVVRGVHRPARRRVGQVLHGAGRPGRRREVTTIEGLADGDRLHPMQEAFREHHGLQCGYCTPGMVMAAVSLLARAPRPDRGRGPRGPRGQPVPLHRLPQHREGRPGRRQGAGARARA